MRIVLDTNLLVSGVIAAGLPRRLVDGAKERGRQKASKRNVRKPSTAG